ncbi:MAG: hypothetical protein KME33_12355 [Aetokthonos hydrillicola CCALA 1050]|nr:hypothetical protein [Aetokthonos hydrillicola CCALA 1050]
MGHGAMGIGGERGKPYAVLTGASQFLNGSVSILLTYRNKRARCSHSQVVNAKHFIPI